MKHHRYYALADTVLEEINQVGNGDEEATDTEDLYQEEAERRALDDHDPSICVCGDPYCHGCPSDEEFEAEVDGDYEAEDNSQGTAKWT